MADKPNIYRGLSGEQELMKEKMKQSAAMHLDSEGIPDGLLVYFPDKVDEIRDDVAVLKGKLELAIKGLEKTSKRIPYYEEGLKWCEGFLRITKEGV